MTYIEPYVSRESVIVSMQSLM